MTAIYIIRLGDSDAKSDRVSILIAVCIGLRDRTLCLEAFLLLLILSISIDGARWPSSMVE